MARLVKSFLGGITTKFTGGDSYEPEVPANLVAKTNRGKENNSPEGTKLLSSSDEDDEVWDQPLPSRSGTLSKWTNYLQGWQERHVVISRGILSYYKSELNTHFGCRGSISLHNVKILLHEFDEVRFDIRAHDCTYFFRAASPDEKNSWIEVIEANKKFLLETGYQPPITRQGSILSLSALSQTSTSSKRGQDLQAKLSEMDTYRDILCRQVDTLQLYFDTIAENNSQANNNTGVVNGEKNSNESIDELPEENREGSFEEGPSYSSSLMMKSEDSNQRLSNGYVNGGSHYSPISNRTGPNGHRRTGSDPFAFKQPLYHNRLSHPRFTVGSGANGSAPNVPVDLANVDFRGEAITFKATTAGIISTLGHCIDVMNEREKYWQKKFELEQEKRRKAERAAHSAMNGQRVMAYEYSGPDMQEGPHSTLNEEEFFDALEIAYHEDEKEIVNESMCKDGELMERRDTLVATDNNTNSTNMECLSGQIVHNSKSGVTHRLTPLVNEKVSEYSTYIFEPVDGDKWELVHEDMDMKVYRTEREEHGVVVDPLKAQYTAKGVSAVEVINFFFDKETRLQWEGTLESVDITETLAEDTMIFHQLHKRVWPSTQRETVFCSHLCTLSNTPRPENMVGHTWMVCNFSLDHPSLPVTNKLIRATIHVGMVCQTIANKPVEEGEEKNLTRDDVSCKIMYAANVNPGGWAPPSVVRAIAKREISKFMKKFSATVARSVSSTPLTL